MLWTFAEGFGYAVERTVLMERLRAQRDQIRAMVSSAEAISNELTDAEIELGGHDELRSMPIAQTAAAVFIAPESRLHELLTRRELEVLGCSPRAARTRRHLRLRPPSSSTWWSYGAHAHGGRQLRARGAAPGGHRAGPAPQRRTLLWEAGNEQLRAELRKAMLADKRQQRPSVAGDTGALDDVSEVPGRRGGGHRATPGPRPRPSSPTASTSSTPSCPWSPSPARAPSRCRTCPRA